MITIILAFILLHPFGPLHPVVDIDKENSIKMPIGIQTKMLEMTLATTFRDKEGRIIENPNEKDINCNNDGPGGDTDGCWADDGYVCADGTWLPGTYVTNQTCMTNGGHDHDCPCWISN